MELVNGRISEQAFVSITLGKTAFELPRHSIARKGFPLFIDLARNPRKPRTEIKQHWVDIVRRLTLRTFVEDI